MQLVCCNPMGGVRSMPSAWAPLHKAPDLRDQMEVVVSGRGCQRHPQPLLWLMGC